MAIFTAAKSADAICAYLLGLEKQHAQQNANAAWLDEYERAEERALTR